MALATLAPGGRWLQPSPDAPACYVVHEAHQKRLYIEGWQPAADPRVETAMPETQEIVSLPQGQSTPREIALQAQIDQLQAMMLQLMAQKSEQSDGSTLNALGTDSKNTHDDRRPGRGKSAV